MWRSKDIRGQEDPHSQLSHLAWRVSFNPSELQFLHLRTKMSSLKHYHEVTWNDGNRQSLDCKWLQSMGLQVSRDLVNKPPEVGLLCSAQPEQPSAAALMMNVKQLAHWKYHHCVSFPTKPSTKTQSLSCAPSPVMSTIDARAEEDGPPLICEGSYKCF